MDQLTLDVILQRDSNGPFHFPLDLWANRQRVSRTS